MTNLSNIRNGIPLQGIFQHLVLQNLSEKIHTKTWMKIPFYATSRGILSQFWCLWLFRIKARFKLGVGVIYYGGQYGIHWLCNGPATWNKMYISCIVPTFLCKLVGANLRPIWWLILMSISCILVHALFNSVVHAHSFKVSSLVL
jgi:hypothetical protein